MKKIYSGSRSAPRHSASPSRPTSTSTAVQNALRRIKERSDVEVKDTPAAAAERVARSKVSR